MASEPEYLKHELCYCSSLAEGRCDYCTRTRRPDLEAYRQAWLEYKNLYNELAQRANVLERRMGQIALILRDDMTGKPVRDF